MENSELFFAICVFFVVNSSGLRRAALGLLRLFAAIRFCQVRSLCKWLNDKGLAKLRVLLHFFLEPGGLYAKIANL